MLENYERIPLDAEDVADVAGGKLSWASSQEYGCFVRSKADLDTWYTFDYEDFMTIKEYIRVNCQGWSDAQILARLQEERLIRFYPH